MIHAFFLCTTGHPFITVSEPFSIGYFLRYGVTSLVNDGFLRHR
ncbi:hypothetical protein NXX02_17005 [Bacteroides fragilis]|mgnify:CR=1 FL=1|nr:MULTISPECIES: hypothetical protein [Bacteroides]MCS2393976.1 hypothetical protein [Bacteroides fragilis]MCX8464257.1 hypothetical protein [Bacteroides fragilis]MCY6334158.1 hypothetical protein [Bacteroides fragilis]MCZ2663460.1 hypothetical protein [Bacteroides fragilis]MDV6145614.1 hypothetical protein [Bacteroides hominis (ex Liu et al. 2022)]